MVCEWKTGSSVVTKDLAGVWLSNEEEVALVGLLAAWLVG